MVKKRVRLLTEVEGMHSYLVEGYGLASRVKDVVHEVGSWGRTTVIVAACDNQAAFEKIAIGEIEEKRYQALNMVGNYLGMAQ